MICVVEPSCTSSEQPRLPAGLYVVATPIGNLGDISMRALGCLRAADLVMAEDTRRTLQLLRHYGIRVSLASCHQGNEARRSGQVIEEIRAGRVVALVTDSGTPGVSDPGGRIVSACYGQDLPVVCVPGPSALAAAISICGFSLGEFVFGGFLPPNAAGRRRRLEAYAGESRAVVLFESPHRFIKLLEAVASIMPDRRMFVGRELTKKYEEGMLGTASEIQARFTGRQIRGEFVIVLSPLRKREIGVQPGRAGDGPGH